MSAKFKKLFRKVELSAQRDTGIVNNKSSFIMISYYWGKERVNKGSIHGLTYGEQVDRFVGDCIATNTNYYIVRYPEIEKGDISYQDALGLKPYFIKKCLKQFPNHKCIFIDTDMRVLKYPALFDIDADLWFINWTNIDVECVNPYQLELSGAVMGFANTHNSRTCLDILLKEYNPIYSEDKSFSGIITRNFLNVTTRCVWLPETYLYMFTTHEYTPRVGYTHVSTYKEELDDSNYKVNDLVLVHEDFETGALDDVFNERVGRDRYPPKLDLQFGEKLRCISEKYDYYTRWGLTNTQELQYKHLVEDKIYSKVINVKQMPKLTSLRSLKVAYKQMYKSKYTILHIHQDDQLTDTFIRYCKMHRISCIIVSVPLNSSLPQVIYSVIKKIDSNILYLDHIPKKMPIDFNTHNIDFMIANYNDSSKCYDPRILRTCTPDMMYFANNDITKDFIKIWHSHNQMQFIRSNIQEKSLEYAFNKSLAINKLRCFWIPLTYCSVKAYSSVPNKVNAFTKMIQQCGLKPARSKNMKPYKKHYSGSRPTKQSRVRVFKDFL